MKRIRHERLSSYQGGDTNPHSTVVFPCSFLPVLSVLLCLRFVCGHLFFSLSFFIDGNALRHSSDSLLAKMTNSFQDEIGG
jgi:hypothetical protein